jgi:2'-5' RNA ligase
VARPSANLRLFVAIYPPPEIAAAALDAIAAMELPPHRLTPAEQAHVTLQFIGDTPAKELDATLESVRRAASGIGAFALAPQRYITLPDRGRPRLIALETDAPARVVELHRRLAHRLAQSPRRDPADRFLPHLTLARFRPGPARRIEAPAELPGFSVERVRVMRSVLRSEGAEHREVGWVVLAG